MNETMEVLNIEIQKNSAAQTMDMIRGYLGSEGLNTIEVVTMDTLLLAEEHSLKNVIESFDMVLPGEREILRASGEADELSLQEMKDSSLWKMVTRYLEKKKVRIFCLTESEQELKSLQEYMHKHYRGIRVVGGSEVAVPALSEEQVVNRMNAASADCIIGVLPTPLREEFICRNRALINAKLWIGIDRNIIDKEEGHKNKLESIVMKFLFRHKVEHEKK